MYLPSSTGQTPWSLSGHTSVSGAQIGARPVCRISVTLSSHSNTNMRRRASRSRLCRLVLVCRGSCSSCSRLLPILLGLLLVLDAAGQHLLHVLILDLHTEHCQSNRCNRPWFNPRSSLPISLDVLTPGCLMDQHCWCTWQTPYPIIALSNRSWYARASPSIVLRIKASAWQAHLPPHGPAIRPCLLHMHSHSRRWMLSQTKLGMGSFQCPAQL